MKQAVDKNIIEATRYFIALVEMGSYTAVKNFYSVELNTVKSKLEALEKYLDLNLYQNVHNKIVITKNGMKYYHSCHKLYFDLEGIINRVKYKGLDASFSIRILSTRAGLNFTIPYVLPRLNTINPSYTFTFDSYFLYQNKSYHYQLDNYDIAVINSRDLHIIDQDRWIVCYTLDSANIHSNLYAKKEYIEANKLNDPNNVAKAPFVFRRDEMINHSFGFESGSEKKSYPINNIKYVVEDDTLKVKFIESGLGIGILPEHAADVLLEGKEGIAKIEGLTSDIFMEEQLIIVSKYLTDRKEIITAFRESFDEFLKKWGYCPK
ncbi:DNA-binding transcriptional LysR family regulator [Allofrancisella inopinata]|uniref:LysR family transcriptional regulator n=1 Tax=Allofrancisella inopinata TaxID=1085647 RepID=A0AAE7CR69_9GAMM|nr:LysR family transcriptional regulator [Allofrancisella inopinata]QIV96690.1 LysR family transcriptional regulator [Allofrancisella inopinata]TDT73442.1 DNA-binding transcriptional LysR family regulator [Allofrancisella inopinata]